MQQVNFIDPIGLAAFESFINYQFRNGEKLWIKETGVNVLKSLDTIIYAQQNYSSNPTYYHDLANSARNDLVYKPKPGEKSLIIYAGDDFLGGNLSVITSEKSFREGTASSIVQETFKMAKEWFASSPYGISENIDNFMDEFKDAGTYAAMAGLSIDGMNALAHTSMYNAPFEGLTCSTEISKTGKAGGSESSGDAETVDLYRAVGIREYEAIKANNSFASGGNSMSSRQFAFTEAEALQYANTDLSKVTIVKVTVPRSSLKNYHLSNSIDPHIFKNGVITVYEELLDVFNKSIINIQFWN